jgi:hypothetical protein
LAFLVRPKDTKTLQKIIRYNSRVWGGWLNGIIPFYEKLPRRWGDRHFRNPPVKDVLNGYLDAFEPDYVVLADDKMRKWIRGYEGRIVTLGEALDSRVDEFEGYGLPISLVYHDLHEKVFRFQQKNPPKLATPLAKDEIFGLLISAVYGDLRSDLGRSPTEELFKKTFEAADLLIDPSKLLKVFWDRIMTPINLTTVGITTTGQGWLADPTLFFLDPKNGLDLIDFWNLRALGWNILPVPRPWASDLLEDCNRFVDGNYKPYQHNPKMMHGTTVLCSRGCFPDEVADFVKRLASPGSGAFSRQDWYPRVWDEWAWRPDHVMRCRAESDSVDSEINISRGFFTFDSLTPKFAEDVADFSQTPRWANIIELHDYSGSVDALQVVPPGIDDLATVLQASSDRNALWATREGITLSCVTSREKHFMTIPESVKVFEAWTKPQGKAVEISGAGNIAREVIRALEGRGIGRIAHEPIIQLLNEMAHAQVELPLDEDDPKSKKVRGQTISRESLWKILMKVNEGREIAAENHLKGLLECRILQVGLRIQCPKCRQRNWFSLSRLDEQLSCDRCLAQFPFPANRPPERSWHYRAIGPFAVENYALGSYAVALSLRFFSEIGSREGLTWVPSFELKDKAGKKLEADLGVFWRGPQLDNQTVKTIFVECKTYDRFDAKDVRKMRALGKAFPGTILAFATCRVQLNLTEKRLISQLARHGRKHLAHDKWRSPVLILTGTELFGRYGPPICWKGKGGKHDQMSGRYRGYGSIQELCDATQQLYLDMESYSKWQEEEMTKRHKRNQQKITSPLPADWGSLAKAAQHPPKVGPTQAPPTDSNSSAN